LDCLKVKTKDRAKIVLTHHNRQLQNNVTQNYNPEKLYWYSRNYNNSKFN